MTGRRHALLSPRMMTGTPFRAHAAGRLQAPEDRHQVAQIVGASPRTQWITER